MFFRKKTLETRFLRIKKGIILSKFISKLFFVLLVFFAGIIFDQIFIKNYYDISSLKEKYFFNELSSIYKDKKDKLKYIKHIIINEFPVIIKKLNSPKSELNYISNQQEKELRKALVYMAQSYIGKRYVLSGDNPENGFDCSGLVWYVYDRLNIKIPRNSQKQYLNSRQKKFSEIKIGDLVFFEVYPHDNLINHFRDIMVTYFIRTNINHVGIYVGDGKFIHAPREGKNVMISDLNSKYWRNHFIGAGDYITDNINSAYKSYERTKTKYDGERKEILKNIKLDVFLIDSYDNKEEVISEPKNTDEKSDNKDSESMNIHENNN